LQRVEFFNEFKGPNQRWFAAKRLKTLEGARTLNQRVEGSSPSAPTNEIKHLAHEIAAGIALLTPQTECKPDFVSSLTSR
jgi:hypothetical protein